MSGGMNGEAVGAGGASSYAGALAAMEADPACAGWCSLPFFREGEAARIVAALDREAATGAAIVPPPADIFAALRLTPLEEVRVVILGQDPYPTPGHAHGLAFSCRGSGTMPASLRTILAEVAADTGAPPRSADLTAWAQQGVLLLNTALSSRARESGAHLRLGWGRLAREAVAAVTSRPDGAVLMLWGNAAKAFAEGVDPQRNLILTCGHPSPLNRLRDFRGNGHFGKANAWLAAHGKKPIAWDG